MMRLQYESFIKRLYALIEEEFEISTVEGDKVFRELGLKLFEIYLEKRLKRQ
jgi:hypothetical protein